MTQSGSRQPWTWAPCSCLGFQTLQQVWDPAGVWDKAAPHCCFSHCYFSARREVPTQWPLWHPLIPHLQAQCLQITCPETWCTFVIEELVGISLEVTASGG